MKPLPKAASTALLTFLLLAVMATGAAATDELYLLGGWVDSARPADQSYSWQLEYRHNMFKHLAAGVSYLNEGHVKGHHRDGYTAQLWGRAELLDYRLTLTAGLGPYFFLDTIRSSSPGGFSDNHGWKAMLSTAATWHTEKNFLFELRSNWVKGPSGFDTVSALAGIGYQFEPILEPLDDKSSTPEQKIRNEVTVFLGQTIVNSLRSQHSVAGALEYRRQLSRHFDWSAALLYEGDNRLIRRDGIITQFWASQQLLDDALSVAAGAGAYFNVSNYENPVHRAGSNFVAGIISLTGSYRMTPHWALRATWNRIVTTYERDTDVVLGGVGYRF